MIKYTRNEDGTYSKSGAFEVEPAKVSIQIEGGRPFGAYTLTEAFDIIEKQAIEKSKATRASYTILAIEGAKAAEPKTEANVFEAEVAGKPEKPAKQPKAPKEPKQPKPKKETPVVESPTTNAGVVPETGSAAPETGTKSRGKYDPQQFATLLNEGKTIMQIAEITGASTMSVRHSLGKLGLWKSSRGAKPEPVAVGAETVATPEPVEVGSEAAPVAQ